MEIAWGSQTARGWAAGSLYRACVSGDFAPFCSMVARRGTKANVADSGPHRLKSWTLPRLLECMELWKRTFKQKAGRRSLSWLGGSGSLGSLDSCFTGHKWEHSCQAHLGLRPHKVGSQLPRGGSHTGVRASLPSSLWNTMTQCSKAHGFWITSSPSP